MAFFSTTQFSSLLLVLLIIFMFSGFSEARDHIIKAWEIPSSESASLNHWAEKSRFNVGDSLVWKYDGSKDSVLEVTRRDYITCNTSAPFRNYTDGNTTVRLERSGPFYFISGAEGHCLKGQKLIVVVISKKHSHSLISPAASPAPGIEGPAAAPPPASGAGSLGGGFLVTAMGALLVVL